jgi:hypothetical protein
MTGVLRRRHLGIRGSPDIWLDSLGRPPTTPKDARQNPSVREQVKVPYYWLSVLTFCGAAAIWLVANSGWPHALAAVLYVVTLIASALARQDARARKDLRESSCGPA